MRMDWNLGTLSVLFASLTNYAYTIRLDSVLPSILFIICELLMNHLLSRLH